MKQKVRIYFAFQFFFSLLVWLPVFYEIQKKSGLSDQQIFKIQSIYYLLFCFIEIPTGFFADRFHARTSMRIGAVCLLFSNLAPIVSQNYTGFLLNWVIIAFARSFISGASSSYLYEHLKAVGFTKEFKTIEGKARGYSLFGKIICFSIVAYLMKFNLMIPYWITAFSAFLAILVSFKLEPTKREKENENKVNTLEQIKKSIFVYRNHPSIILVMFQGIGFFVLNRICQVNLFQPILQIKNIPNSTHGMIMSFMICCEAFGSLRPDVPEMVLSKMTDRKKILMYAILISLGLIITVVSHHYYSLLGLGLFSYGLGLAGPVQGQLMNDAIPDSSIRATILSTESILDRALCAWAALYVGTVVANSQVNQFLIISAFLSIVLVICVGFLIDKKGVSYEL